MKKTLVIGASEDTARYSNIAINFLKNHQYAVVAIGNKTGEVRGVPFSKERPDWKDIDTVTLYINPAIQAGYYDYIISLKPRRIIFNPGTENSALEQLAQEAGIETLNACTLVLLNTGQY